MKKNIRAAMIIAAIALVTSFKVFNSQRSITMSDIALANVEALADGEVIVGVPCMVTTNNYCIYLGPSANDYFEWPGVLYN